jgi:hypothetical protein
MLLFQIPYKKGGSLSPWTEITQSALENLTVFEIK